MRRRYFAPRVLAAALLAALTCLAGQSAGTGRADGPSYAFSWTEGSHLKIVEFWNAQARAACEYATNPWPQARLAAERAYVLATRQVLREEWDISGWIAANRAGTSSAHIHGAETNCPNGHLDWPPHVHVFYEAPDSTGAWHEINTHNYDSAQGQIYDTFVIPAICGITGSYHAAPNAWVDILDETCTAAWQQRYTTVGDLELRRAATTPIYSLRGRSINGDLAGADVLLAGAVIYTVDVVTYDPVGERMVAQIKDYRKRTTTTETWWGDPATGTNLAGHTTQTTAWPPPSPAPFIRHVYLPLLSR